jgi:hypothetical protein
VDDSLSDEIFVDKWEPNLGGGSDLGSKPKADCSVVRLSGGKKWKYEQRSNE